jgi:hypothetical protein
MLVSAAALVGLGVGLLLPRPWSPASPVIPPTPIASQLDLENLLNKVLSDRDASAQPGGASYVNPTGGLSGKHYAGIYQLIDATKAEAVTLALQKEVEAAIESRGGAIWNRGTGTTSIDDKTGMAYWERSYRLAGRAGTVHAWCAHRGEYVSVVLVFYGNRSRAEADKRTDREQVASWLQWKGGRVCTWCSLPG